MTIGVSKELTKIGIEEEVTEGTHLEPTAATSFVQPQSDGFGMSGTKETKERNILTEGFFQARPRVGKKSLEWNLSVEMRGAGVEGDLNDYDPLLKNMFGGRRQLTARKTTGTGHTTTVINLADTSDIVVGDTVVILEAAAHHISPVVTVTTNTSIEILVPAASAPSDAVEIAKFSTYFGSNTSSDYKTLALSYYHGDEILEKGIGARPNSLALSNWTTGEIATFDFSGTGIDFDRVDGSAPFTPVYDDETPPLILSACLYIDGVQLDVNNFSFSVEHDNGELPSTCAESGVLSTRKVNKRRVSFSVDPYLDDADVSVYNKFKNNTAFSIFAFAANPGATGEYDLGSIVSFYLPNCISTSNVVGDLDGILNQAIEGISDGGEAGESNEIFISMT